MILFIFCVVRILYLKVELLIDHGEVDYALLCAMIAGRTCCYPNSSLQKIELFFDGPRFMQYLPAVFFLFDLLARMGILYFNFFFLFLALVLF